MKHTGIIFIVFFLSVLAASANVSAQPYRISHLGVDDGLSNNYIVSLTQDRKGYIWIATESGLNRFDGQQFIVYNKSNSGLSSNELNALLADPKQDKIWIGTQRDGLCCFDYESEKITCLKTGESQLASNDIPYLARASDGGIWITHYHMGIQHYDTQKNQFSAAYNYKTIKGLPGRYWTGLDDGEGNLYIGHVTDGLSIIDMKRNTFRNYRHDPHNPNSIPGDEVYSICIDRNKNVWVGTNKEAALFNPATQQFTAFRHNEEDEYSLLPGTVMDIKQMKNGDLWFGTSMGGISILNMQSNTFTDARNIRFRNISATNDEYGLTGPYVRRMLQDSFGNIWIGNYCDGLDFISYEPSIFSTLRYTTEKQGKTRYKQVWSLCIDHKQQLWMGGESELALYKKGERIQVIPLPTSSSHPHAYIRAIREDSKKRIWIGTWEAGLFYYEPEKRQFTQVHDSDSQPADVRCFYEEPDGKLWIGSRNGVYSFYNEKLTREESVNEQLGDHIIQGICRDSQGKLWVGTFGKGIFVFDSQGKRLVNHQKDNGFPSNAVNSLTNDSQGRVWAATREGAILFQDTRTPDDYLTFSNAEGLVNTQVRAVCEDRDGNIWISTNAGISRLNESQKMFYNYDHRDGIPLGDFMDGASARDAEGKLYFGSQNGTCHFDPSSLSAAQIIAPVTITRFFVYRKQTESDDFDILTAEDGSEGWTLAQERIPSIIVSDIMMPVMDGIQLCRSVKDDIRTSHIPIILLTAKDSLHDKEEGYTAGADSYLTKPFSAKLLHSRINNLLEARKKLAASLTAVIPHPTEPATENTDILNPLDNEFLQRITQIIEDNLEMEKMDIAFIADKMCMSHSTLYRKIKGVADMSANEFIRKVKMRNGVRLLLSGKYSISEISYMIGFSSVTYFRQCFKSEFGMAPSEYVKLQNT